MEYWRCPFSEKKTPAVTAWSGVEWRGVGYDGGGPYHKKIDFFMVSLPLASRPAARQRLR